MRLRLESLVALLECPDQERLFSSLSSLTQELGFERFLVGARHATSGGSTEDRILSSYSPGWLKRYQEEQYASIDPVVSHAVNSSIPLIWSDQLYDSQQRLQFREEAESYGIREGVSIPVRTRMSTGVISLVSETQGTEIQRHIVANVADILLLSTYAYEALLKLGASHQSSQPRPVISVRETECLKWSSVGKTAWEISQILNISERTVNFHLGNAAVKLGTRGTRHTVSRAIVLGLI
jgi:DNA-binding CsgD family transcriptional regulator